MFFLAKLTIQAHEGLVNGYFPDASHSPFVYLVPSRSPRAIRDGADDGADDTDGTDGRGSTDFAFPVAAYVHWS